MKNLFKVSVLALGLGLGFSQGASASPPLVKESYTYSVDANADSVTDNFSSLASVNKKVFTYTIENALSDKATFSGLIKGLAAGVAANPRVLDVMFTVDGTSSFVGGASASSASSSSSWSAISNLYLNNVLINTNTTNLLAGQNYDWRVSFNNSSANANNKYVMNTDFNIAAVSPVPEAEEWAMMFVGLGLIGVVAGKQKEGSFKITHN